MGRTLDRKEFVHYRFINQDGTPHSHGGVTVCYLPGPEGARIGVAVCSPRENFNRRLGCRISEGRAAISPVSAGIVASHEELIATVEGRVKSAIKRVAERKLMPLPPSALKPNPRRKS